MRIEERKCNDTDELLDLIDPNNSYWSFKSSPRTDILNRNGWLFRGHMDSKWDLQPSAFRDGSLSNFVWWLDSLSPSWETDHFIVAELSAVKEFLKIADANGIPTPMTSDIGMIISDCIFKTNHNLSHSDKIEVEMPPKQLLESFSLAQHHGIPTRLLDWSYNIYHSLFFAANDSWTHTNPNDDGYLAIWAINKFLLELDDIRTSRIQLLHSPYSSNNYLMNQAGLFTYDSQANPYHRENQKWQSQNEIFENSQSSNSKINPVRKITIHWRHSKDILMKLVERRINPVSLMPTLDNVTKTMVFSKKLYGS